jgi:RecB family exonuclease
MKIRPTVSKSSIENFELCPMQYFYGYNLGYRSEAGLATVIGSAVHGVMEALALMKKDIQEGKTGKITHEEMGELTYTEEEFWAKRTLSDDEVDEINKSRTNKSVYIDQKTLPYKTVRMGEELVARLIDRARDAYLSKFDMKPADVKKYVNFVWMLLESFDLREYNVVAVEFPFDIPITEKWAEIEDGYVRIKGFIDLIVEIEGDYWIYDYKSGQRSCFITGEKKTLAKIRKDLQLAMYTYVIRKLFPDRNVIANLLFIRDGGLFTVTFDDTVLDFVESEVERHVKNVAQTKIPAMLDPTCRNFKCKNFCGAAKNHTFSDHVCDCQFLASKIREIGIDEVEKLYHKDRFEKFEV